MRLVSEGAGALECSGCEGGGGAVVVVGVKLDARSRELLTWALVKVAQPGDRVIALHILDPTADKSSLLSLVKTFDSLLAAYEGFCNLKQVDLRLKVCRGSPVSKILSREAKSCGATSVIVGTSGVRRTIRSRIAVAKYCAKNLQKNVSVICVDNGKILFRRKSTASTDLEVGSLDASESKFQKRKSLSKSPLSLSSQKVASPSTGNENLSMALVPIKTQEMPESKSGWTLLRRLLLRRRSASEASSTKKPSVVQWLLRTPRRQSDAAVYPDQKQISASNTDDCCLGLDGEKGAIVLYSDDSNSDAYSKNFLEELKDLGEKYSANCRLFSYQELLLAANNFQPENLIGRGGSSQVYRGCLPGGWEIAVKILKPSKDVLRQFVSEIEIITSLHHKNIISLVGFSFEEDRLLLVYNLLSRGCLEENLHGTPGTGNLFGWEERYKVALGVADALDCLHNRAEPIIHRDVKSSNILLSDDFDPQLSDFGLSTCASSCSHHMDTSDVAGTFGYLAPEYFMHGKLNEKIDVYAFGVVLLELLSGRKSIDNGHPKGQESLVMWAKHILKEGKISELQDPNLVNACDPDQFERMVLAATLCIRDAPQERPDISSVLKLLQGDPEVVDWARQETNASEDINAINGEQSATNIQSFINLALLNLEHDTASISSTEQNISVEDYLGADGAVPQASIKFSSHRLCPGNELLVCSSSCVHAFTKCRFVPVEPGLGREDCDLLTSS
ncbi:Receptor-like cytosolic serine/threonine-protein kinase RBK1 [Sesamum alatum]|uniref:Receptor-like cytosolic serine/threonine-protein kinase RBK1 n=1 Tax=Sesamum alatum TaxID=300844 RepID=A0AAE1Y789_9LAMI|nr:Receptor-like cytosolic serine/threonine-protein kinase RBK1 [Sesamum alatum]